jgi:hypothetical protein
MADRDFYPDKRPFTAFGPLLAAQAAISFLSPQNLNFLLFKWNTIYSA